MIRLILAAVCTVAALAAGICYHIVKDKGTRLESLMWLLLFVVLATRLV